jgi:hypothetical protein
MIKTNSRETSRAEGGDRRGPPVRQPPSAASRRHLPHGGGRNAHCATTTRARGVCRMRLAVFLQKGEPTRTECDVRKLAIYTTVRILKTRPKPATLCHFSRRVAAIDGGNVAPYVESAPKDGES